MERAGTDLAAAVAFSDLVARHSPALLARAARLEGSQPAGEELLQAVLVRTWAHFNPAWDDPTFVAYVRAAMVNAQRSRWRRPVQEVPTAEPAPGPYGERAESRVDDADQLRRALRRLPAHQRNVVVLRFYDDLSEMQMAARLRTSVGTVKSQTSRALARLRPLLDVAS